MTMPELWGWTETFLRALGVWDLMSAAITVTVIVSLGFWGLSMLRR